MYSILCCVTESFVNISSKISALKIETYRNLATIFENSGKNYNFKILTKLILLENILYICNFSTNFLGGGHRNSSEKRRNIAESLDKSFGKIL